jgi:hypothetical protein
LLGILIASFLVYDNTSKLSRAKDVDLIKAKDDLRRELDKPTNSQQNDLPSVIETGSNSKFTSEGSVYNGVTSLFHGGNNSSVSSKDDEVRTVPIEELPPPSAQIVKINPSELCMLARTMANRN